MRVIKYIPIMNIKVDRFSISPETYDLALKIDCGEFDLENMRPIKVVLDKSTGVFILRDGRHRITAHKLLGMTNIKATYYK